MTWQFDSVLVQFLFAIHSIATDTAGALQVFKSVRVFACPTRPAQTLRRAQKSNFGRQTREFDLFPHARFARR